MLLTAGERISMALLCMAIIDLGDAGGVVHRLAGRDRHRHRRTARPRSSRSGPTASARRSTAGSVAVVAGFQGVSTDARHHHARPGRLRHHRGRARRRARRRRLRDLHRRRRRLHRRPAHRARRPPARPRSRTTRCSRWRPPAGGCSRCGRSSSRATTACRCTCVRASPGSRAPGSPRRSRSMEAADHLGRHPRHLGGEGHDRPGARPARRRRDGVPRARRRGRQRRHDRAERVDRRATPTSRSPSRSDELAAHDGGHREGRRRDRRRRLPTTTTASAGSRSSARA